MFSLRKTGSGKQSGVWTSLCVRGERADVGRVLAGAAGQKPVVTLWESIALGKDALDGLTRLRKKFSLQKASATTLLQPTEYQLLQLETPAVAEPGEKLEVFRNRITGMIDAPIAHVTFDTFDIPTETLSPGRPRNSYAVVAGNAAIAPKVQLFHHAGIRLKAIDIPELAQRNLARLCEREGRALAFLAFDETGGLLTFTANGELFMFRRIDVALTAMLTDDMDRRSTLYDRVGLEVQRSLDNFDRQYGGFLPLSRLVIAPQPESMPLQGFLKDYLGITVDTLDLAELMDISGVPELQDPARQSQSLQCLGAALRGEAAL